MNSVLQRRYLPGGMAPWDLANLTKCSIPRCTRDDGILHSSEARKPEACMRPPQTGFKAEMDCLFTRFACVRFWTGSFTLITCDNETSHGR